jgi:hypothetical protein
MGRAEVGFVVVEGKGGGGFATIMELVIWFTLHIKCGLEQYWSPRSLKTKLFHFLIPSILCDSAFCCPLLSIRSHLLILLCRILFSASSYTKLMHYLLTMYWRIRVMQMSFTIRPLRVLNFCMNRGCTETKTHDALA